MGQIYGGALSESAGAGEGNDDGGRFGQQRLFYGKLSARRTADLFGPDGGTDFETDAGSIQTGNESGKADYQFVEIMACPGGCVMGGGQPIKSSKERAEKDIRKLRADCLYSIDEKSVIRKSHENPIVKKIYKDYLEKPGSHKAHELLHTHYEKREKYDI